MKILYDSKVQAKFPTTFASSYTSIYEINLYEYDDSIDNTNI